MAKLPEDVLVRDHEYWRRLVSGMLGDWLTDKTTVREIAGFVDRISVRHNLEGFTGDPRFVENDCARRIFSKLRASMGGLYAWRLGPGAPPEYQPKSEADKEALLREADFAFRQAFALGPSSPEAIFRYVAFLMQFNRMDDALLVAEAGLKADPKNGTVRSLLDSIRSSKRQR